MLGKVKCHNDDLHQVHCSSIPGNISELQKISRSAAGNQTFICGNTDNIIISHKSRHLVLQFMC